MSLFQAREWWSTWCGDADEEFDHGSLVIANIDNSADGQDKVVIGSLNGVLRIFKPQADGFKPEHLMLEMQMNYPILQLSSGKFVSGSDNIQFAVLHPRSLAVYETIAVTGSVDHGNHYTVSLIYEHRLERSAFAMTHGPFGNVTGKDFVCIMSMDGVLTFYEQETFSFKVYLPNFLLPGPFVYIPSTDSFVVATSGRFIESYRYQALASSAQKSGKKTPDWSKSVGENVISFQALPSVLVVLCEHTFFLMSFSSEVQMMKKLEYNPSCLCAYQNPKTPEDVMVLVGTFSKSLQIYKGIKLTWAAQLPEVPLSCKIGNFVDLKGVLVTVDEFGHLYCSFLGTDPSLFTAPHVDSRQGNFAELDQELKTLNAFIKEAELGKESGGPVDAKNKEKLKLKVLVPDQIDATPRVIDKDEENGDIVFPTVTVKVVLQWHCMTVVENITLICSAKYPIVCSSPQIYVPVLGDKGPELTFDVSFYTTGDAIPADLELAVTASYVNESGAPRVVQAYSELPLSLICTGTPPSKQAQHKLTIDTNKEPVNLAEIFSEMVNDAVIPIPMLGIQYVGGGPVVSVLSSKQSNRYRIQSDHFEALWLILDVFIKRLTEHFGKKNEAPFKPSVQAPLPLSEYFEMIDRHFEIRLAMENYKSLLQQRAHQFRVIQKRLLTRFKDKTPSPLQHLDTLLDGTYKQILAIGEEYENRRLALQQISSSLSCATNLINCLIKLLVSMNNEEYGILRSCLCPVVGNTHEQGWEETVNSNISFLLRTCLAKSVKEQNNVLPTLTIAKDTERLKKNIALLVERVSGGKSVSFSNNARY